MAQSATMYGYSSTRVKAMESKLLEKNTINQLSKMDNVASMVGLLLQTNYKDYIEEFGGKDVKGDLIDFALSRSLENRCQETHCNSAQGAQGDDIAHSWKV